MNRTTQLGIRARALIPALAAACLLAGCMGSTDVPSMKKLGQDVPGEGYNSLAAQKGVNSPLIAELQGRKSVLAAGGTYARVADAILAANSGAAAAELRMARLKAEARAKNWLPNIGPSVSLSSLSGLAASLIVEQGLFDNGRRKAERAFAAADVEVAAVTLAEDINGRVYSGLKLYVQAERARAQAGIASKGAERLQHFQSIMDQRVAGGLSDRSEAQVISQRLAEMSATLGSDRAAEAAAMAELGALTANAVSGAGGLERLGALPTTEPLSVLKARGEGARDIALADAERAGMMPGLSATAGITETGIEPGLRLNGMGMLSPGASAQMEAINSTPDLVSRRTAEAAQEAERQIVALQREIGLLQNREAQGGEVLRQTEENLELFTEQYKLGGRSLLELVGQYDSYARLERDQAALRFEVAMLELQIARERGLLVDGARM